MKKHILTLSVALFVGTQAIAASPTTEMNASQCTDSAVDEISDASSLRALALACAENIRIWTLVKQKLLVLPYPKPPSLRLTPQVAGGRLESAVYELDVFFDVFEAYPPDIAFEKLGQLIEKIGASSAVESIEIEAGADSTEIDSGIGNNVASMRAFRIRRYLLDSGLPSSIPVKVAGKEISREQTADGRARARSVSVRVVTKRNAR